MEKPGVDGRGHFINNYSLLTNTHSWHNPEDEFSTNSPSLFGEVYLNFV